MYPTVSVCDIYGYKGLTNSYEGPYLKKKPIDYMNILLVLKYWIIISVKRNLNILVISTKQIFPSRVWYQYRNGARGDIYPPPPPLVVCQRNSVNLLYQCASPLSTESVCNSKENVPFQTDINISWFITKR